MKYFICLAFITLSYWAGCQKIYQIGKVEWTFAKPADFKSRIDNFSSSIENGAKFTNKYFDTGKQSDDDKVLFAIGKKDSVDI